MRRALLAAAAAVALLAGGCGIPEQTEVKELGPGRVSGVSTGQDNPPPRIEREATTDRITFIKNYLQAAAGNPDSALERVTEFLAPDAVSAFKVVVTDLRVVRLVEEPLVNSGADEATIKVRQVGTLNSQGVLKVATDTAEKTYSITVGEVPGRTGLFVKRPPLSALLISDEALRSFYEQRTIYFWNTEKSGLVPDVRYMLKETPRDLQPTTIVNWLVGGPADWLRDSVVPLADKTQLVGSSVPAVTEGKLEIRLSAEAADIKDTEAVDRLRRQLQWSLRPLLPGKLALKIGNQDTVEYLGNDYYESNAAYRLVSEPERFVLFGGKIRRLQETPREEAPIPVLPPEANGGIGAAAMSASRTHTFAAVVSAGRTETLRVAAATNGARGTPRVVSGLPAQLGNPAWAVTSIGQEGAIGLIPTAQGLYSFRPDGTADLVSWPGAASGPVTAVAVAPDGHRVALVAGGRLYRAVLIPSGKGVQLSEPEPILVPPLRTVTGADFIGEGWLTVVGERSDKRFAIFDISVDGALWKRRLDDIGTQPVTYLSAYPSNPVTGTAELVSYETPNGAFDALSTAFAIKAEQIAGGTGRPPAGARPSAPFYFR